LKNQNALSVVATIVFPAVAVGMMNVMHMTFMSTSISAPMINIDNPDDEETQLLP
jgi:hypothetical protein